MTNPTAAPLSAEQVDKLEALAKAATQGEWKWDGRREDVDGYVYIPECSYIVGGIALTYQHEDYQTDCDFIAAANPQTILALIAQARTARLDTTASASGLLNSDELAAFHRFCECAEDFDSGGHDVDKEMMAKLARIGVVRSTGFGRHETTAFGDMIRDGRAILAPVAAQQAAAKAPAAQAVTALEGKLLPCPFCGGEPKIQTDDESGYWIECANSACGSSTNIRIALMDDVRPLLIEQWNRRATPPTIEGRHFAGGAQQDRFDRLRSAGEALSSCSTVTYAKYPLAVAATTGDDARDAQPPIMFGERPVENMQIDLLARCLKENSWFDGEGLEKAWNELVAFYVANRAPAMSAPNAIQNEESK